jgi:hypothetical protein
MSSRESEANSDSRTVTRLSTTFLLEFSAINSSFSLEDRCLNSKKFFGRLRDHFQEFSGTSYVCFHLFSSTSNARA